MNYKKCEGCGKKMQFTDPNLDGYSPKEDSALCQSCFKSLNYGDKENNLTEFNLESYLEIIKKDNSEVILVVDILNPYQTIIKDLNKYIKAEKLTLVINKVDALPKAIKDQTIINYIVAIAEKRNVDFKNISLVSSTKNKNIDALYEYIQSLNSRVSVIGYSNVGKSSFIKALFSSKLVKINNLVSYTIGTTLAPIELDLDGKQIVDYPGFFLGGNYQNQLGMKQLRKVIPRKEIKVNTYQLNEEQLINIDNIIFFETEKQEETLGYQFSFSNDINIERHKSDKKDKIVPNKFKKISIKPIPKIERQDIVICGVGSITFNNKGQNISVYVPHGIKVDVVESLYN
jgi:ribosome biogenesis GTPase A